jgi:hypothetical protein
MACTRSSGTGHHVDIRSALKPWVTSVAFGARSITRWTLPVWSASSCVSHSHFSSLGSMIELSAAMKSSPSTPMPVSIRTGSSAMMRYALIGSTPMPGSGRLAGKTCTSSAAW